MPRAMRVWAARSERASSCAYVRRSPVSTDTSAVRPGVTRARSLRRSRSNMPGTSQLTKQPLLVTGHPEGGAGLVMADAGADEDDEIARLDFLLHERVIQGHGDAGRAGITPLLHHHVRLFHRETEIGHHQLDGRLPDLREDGEVDVTDGEAAILRHLAHKLWPADVVDLGWIALDHFHAHAPFGTRCRRRRLPRTAGRDQPARPRGAVGGEGGGDEARLVTPLEHLGPAAVALAEDHRS